MPAIDTILVSAINPGAGPSAFTTAVSADALQIRNFQPPARAWLENIMRMGTAAGFVSVRSPLLHDTTEGIQITPGESPSVYSLPGVAAQLLQAQDTLSVFGSGGAAETDIAALTVYYENVPGIAPRLFNWSDIESNIKFLKPIQVAVTSSATIGQWKDTPLTTTENLLHANKDYAVLGYSSNVALGMIGLRGAETGNLRICGPGATTEYPTTQYFVENSKKSGNPWIPVFNAANAGNIAVSVAASTASVTAVVELICVELMTNLPSSQ